MNRDRLIMGAALSAALAIAAGAFGAHAAGGTAADLLKVGAAYQLPHAAAAITVSRLDRRISWTLLAGAAVFALSLYAMALGAPRIVGAITPIGGATMIGAWLWLAVRAR